MIKNRIKNWLLKDLLNAITLNEVIDCNNGRWTINGIEITKEEMEAIKEEAKFIETTRIWHLLQGTLAEQAKESLFNKAKNMDDIMWGKAMLYNLDLQNKTINKLKKL